MATYAEESKAIEESEIRRIKEEVQAKANNAINAYKQQQTEILNKQISPEQNQQLASQINAIKKKYSDQIETYKISIEQERQRLEKVKNSHSQSNLLRSKPQTITMMGK